MSGNIITCEAKTGPCVIPAEYDPRFVEISQLKPKDRHDRRQQRGWSRFDCEHGKPKTLCSQCAGLTKEEIDTAPWGKYRSKGRIIRHKGPHTKSYSDVTISGRDCVLVPRQNGVPLNEVSAWYECGKWGHITEIRRAGANLTRCPRCSSKVVAIVEPFQDAQFSPFIGNGTEHASYVDAKPVISADIHGNVDDAVLCDLFLDPNNRFGAGGTGYLRIPLTAARLDYRADAPEWLDHREEFLSTLRGNRGKRGEIILRCYYLEGMTDAEVSREINWKKDSAKKERMTLVNLGDRFFEAMAILPPRPTIGEED